MLRSSTIYLSVLIALAFAPPAVAWPDATYSDIFGNAMDILPPPLRQLLEDLDSSLDPACTTTSVAGSVQRAVEEFLSPNGSLTLASSAMRGAGCAIATLNDRGMESLVASQQQNFAPVFCGWHSVIEAGSLPDYLRLRNEERELLLNRFGRNSVNVTLR